MLEVIAAHSEIDAVEMTKLLVVYYNPIDLRGFCEEVKVILYNLFHTDRVKINTIEEEILGVIYYQYLLALV